jgi:ribose transport system ATP-binding protein
LLEAQEIDKSYGAARVLRSAHLLLSAGEVHGLVGENGAGKSTLVKILAGEVLSDAGVVLWEGRSVLLRTRRDAERLGISMIHQELNLAPHLTVAQNIFLGHEPSSSGILSPHREITEARAALDRLGFDLDPAAPVSRLGPARRQLVEIARAVIRDARLVIMDEPTSSLSAREVEDLFRVVRQLREHGTAVIFVTHRLEELAEIADRVTVLRDGETVLEGTMPRRDFDEIIRAMVGRELGEFFPRHERRERTDDTVLEVCGLGRGRDFRDVSLTVRRGEIVGIAGLIGAGRTELVEAIFGAAPAESGKILIEGRAVMVRTPQDAIRHGLAMLTEDRRRTGLALNLSIAHNVTLADLSALVRHGRLDLATEERVASDFMDRLRIRAPSPRQRVARLSGGNQQKVVIAKWLFRRARILIFDEPTRGVDVGTKAEIYRLMRELADSGAAILMVSSELPEILGTTDRVLVMRAGRIVKELVTAETTQEEIIRHATLTEI